MPEYENIVYSENTENVSIVDASYSQAVSIGDKLETVKLTTPVVCSSEVEVFAIYPNPKQGDRVYRTDTAAEYQYYETYDSVSNPFGRPAAGWYAISAGMIPIYDGGAYASGTLPGNFLTRLGVLHFQDADDVYFPDCFSSEFNFYRVVVDVTNTNILASFGFQLVSGGSNLTNANYNYQRMINTSIDTTTGSGAFSATLTYFQAESGSRLGTFEALFFVDGTNPVCYLAKFMGNQMSTHSRMQSTSGIYNPSVSVDGLRFFNPTAGVKMSGTMQVWGYKNGI